MITILDYGTGNIHASANIFKNLNIPFTFAKTAYELASATHIVLPGVGSFDWAMERLNNSGMRTTLDNLVLKDKRYVLGICVGMQMMAKRSDEGSLGGLCWFDAEVRCFDDVGIRDRTHLPHMGWNSAQPVDMQDLFQEISAEALFYFLHSYYFAPNDTADVLAHTDYGGCFASAVRRHNIYGVQFHPEKSHGWGVQLLKNFAML
jgi:glutamine amidotransferase